MDKELLRINYQRACNSYLNALAKMWDWDIAYYGYWIGDEIGGVYAYGEEYFLSMEDIIYCVNEGVSEDEFSQYQDYNVRVGFLGLPHINLQSWHKGAPRVSQELLKSIEQAKDKLEEGMKEAKKMREGVK